MEWFVDRSGEEWVDVCFQGTGIHLGLSIHHLFCLFSLCPHDPYLFPLGLIFFFPSWSNSLLASVRSFLFFSYTCSYKCTSLLFGTFSVELFTFACNTSFWSFLTCFCLETLNAGWSTFYAWFGLLCSPYVSSAIIVPRTASKVIEWLHKTTWSH